MEYTVYITIRTPSVPSRSGLNELWIEGRLYSASSSCGYVWSSSCSRGAGRSIRSGGTKFRAFFEQIIDLFPRLATPFVLMTSLIPCVLVSSVRRYGFLADFNSCRHDRRNACE